METRKLFSIFLCITSIVLFTSCDKLKDVAVSRQKSVKIEVETVVNDGVATFSSSSLRSSEDNTFSGSANINLSEILSLSGFDLSEISAVSVTNVNIKTFCTKEGDYYAENIQLNSTGASTTINRVVLGESVSGNSEINSFIQTVLTNLIKGNTVPISISGTTNLNPSGTKIVYTFEIDAKWSIGLL